MAAALHANEVAAARDVDHAHPVLHLREGVRVQPALRLGRDRQVDRHEIGYGVEILRGLGALDARVAAWQNWLTPLHKRIGGGCHLNRRIDALIGAAGFRIGELTTGYQPGPRPFTFTYQGIASPAGADVVAPGSVC